MTGSDGVTFVLREQDQCHYVAEEAISPLWEGRRFPMSECISGWVMTTGQTATIADVFADPRIPHDLYRPTFVRSLAMVPVRREQPVAAIGVYWAHRHAATPAEIGALEVLANAASLALANAELFQDLRRSLDREREANRAVEAAARRQERTRLLAEVEERQRRIIDSIADAIVVVDAQGIVKFANPAAESIFDRPHEEVVGDHFGLPLVAGETTEVDLKGGRSAEMRVVELAWEGEPAYLASLRDVTARRDAEVAARQLLEERAARDAAERQRRRLQDLLERAPVAIMTTRGLEHRCVFANGRMTDLFPMLNVGTKALRQSLGHLSGQGFIEAFDEVYESGRGTSRTALRLELDGPTGRELRYLDVGWEPLWSAGERVDGVMCFAYDVSRQVIMHRDLETALAQLRKEERHKDQFLAVLGHELRNPLAGISAGLDLVETGVEGERRDWTVAMMRRQITVVTALLDDLLDVSAIARGKLQLERVPVDLRDIVEMAVAAVAARLDKRDQRLSIFLPDAAATVHADPRRLAQVVANLLVNASKYSDRGSRVDLRVRRENGYVVITVEDRGIGIEADALEHIFEPFVQGRTASPAIGGLGIGLTLVRQLTELHGGSVSAASGGMGRGSTFTVRLPAIDAPAAGAPAQTRSVADEGTAHTGRVVVVDDNHDAAHALGEVLALAGWEVAVAVTGHDGMSKARTMTPDAIILDLDLPDVSGYEVATRLRGHPELADKLIVALSGYGHEQARERSRRSGIDHHLTKPVELKELLALLNRC